jgi:hypothetical protein
MNGGSTNQTFSPDSTPLAQSVLITRVYHRDDMARRDVSRVLRARKRITADADPSYASVHAYKKTGEPGLWYTCSGTSLIDRSF